MLTAYSNARGNCYAWATDKSEGPFYCKSCSSEVILRKGAIRVHHFAHKPPISCIYGAGESQEHHSAKKAIFETLSGAAICSRCELEEKIDDVIPDINAIIQGNNVAIEIQKSNLTVNEVYKRTMTLSAKGFHVVWVLPTVKQLKIFRDEGYTVCRVPKWLESIHALSFGRIYIWSGHGALVHPVHFDTMYRDVPSTEYYDSYGNLNYAGGYQKPLKDRKTVAYYPGDVIDLATDFRPSSRKAFATKNYTVPACRIWQDSLNKWW